jgi:hypothetical protein
VADPRFEAPLASIRRFVGWFGATGAPGLMRRLGALVLVAVLVGWQTGPIAAHQMIDALGASPAIAATPSSEQQPTPPEPKAPGAGVEITGVLGSANATTTISGKQLPPPDPAFGGVIKQRATVSISVVVAPACSG